MLAISAESNIPFVFESPAFSFIPEDEIPDGPEETDAQIRRYLLNEWKNDREGFIKLAYALDVGEIIPVDRDYRVDNDDFEGQYFGARRDRQLGHNEERLKSWELSGRQRTKTHRALRNHRAVILISYSEVSNLNLLAHEIGHHINWIGGLDRLELLSRVSKAMRRVARFDDYYIQNKDEFYAETWALYLCGKHRPTLFRYLDRPLKQLREAHPEKARLIEEHRAGALAGRIAA